MPLKNYDYDNITVRDTFVSGQVVDSVADSPTPVSDTVQPHHTQHENGGSDEIDVTGLSGLLADAQTPLAHTHPLSDLTQSGAVSGQVVKWNGSAWAPANAGALYGDNWEFVVNGDLSDPQILFGVDGEPVWVET